MIAATIIVVLWAVWALEAAVLTVATIAFSDAVLAAAISGVFTVLNGIATALLTHKLRNDYINEQRARRGAPAAPRPADVQPRPNRRRPRARKRD